MQRKDFMILDLAKVFFHTTVKAQAKNAKYINENISTFKLLLSKKYNQLNEKETCKGREYLKIIF